jgi:hypothetical protein
MTITEHSLESYPGFFTKVLTELLTVSKRIAAMNSHEARDPK